MKEVFLLASFYKEYFQYLPQGYDDVFILHSNSGEVYCFLAYLAKSFINKNNAKNPLFVATKPYHEDIIEMYFPKARSVYYDMYLKEPRLGQLGDNWEYAGHKFWQIFSPRHFNTVNSNLGSVHYFDAMLKTLNLTREDASKPAPKLAQRYKTNASKIAEKIGLDIDNFVIIAPEALTAKEFPSAFWNNLVKELYNNGYDVFINSVKSSSIKGKTCNLSFSELFALAGFSKAVVSLRSGISEFLIPAKTKNIMLCPRFHWSPLLTANQCIEAYSAMKLPFIDKNLNFELNTELYSSESKLIENVIQLIQK